MTVRLGFAVAAHLEPEILVVDEVLAVGDAEFQKKAIGKMQDVSRGEGRTVLFVSHNMASIRALCHNGVLLENGGIKYTGDIESVVLEYQRTNQQYITSQISDRLDRKGNGKLKLIDMKFKNMQDKIIDGVAIGDAFKICVTLQNNGWTSSDEIRELSVGINDEYGQRIIVVNNLFLAKEIHVPEDGSSFQVEFTIKKCPLAIGSYTMAFYLSDKFNNVIDWIDNITTLYVEGGDFFGTGKVNRQGLGRFITDYDIQEV